MSFREFESLERAAAAFREQGCKTIVAKFLSKEDDSKHQVYISRGVPLAQMLPGVLRQRGLSESETKRLSSTGSPIFSLELAFSWIDAAGSIAPAPNAKLIEYSQYPEVRFSGFLKGCHNAPDCLSGADQEKFGQRVLLLGIAGNRVFGTVATELNAAALVGAAKALKPWNVAPALREIPSGSGQLRTNPSQLHDSIRGICGADHLPQVLDPGATFPRETAWSSQSGGWTLEALLGVPRNSASAPDIFGYELKAVGADKVSLITTEPDFGLRKELGLKDFLKVHGTASIRDDQKTVFNGVHKAWIPNQKTGAVLEIAGWDSENHRPLGSCEISIVLRKEKSDEVLAGWTIEKLARQWTKKHALAFYLEYTKKMSVEGVKVSFGPNAIDARSSSIGQFLGRVSRGEIYLDPGDSLSEGVVHSRTQWRIAGAIDKNLADKLTLLYSDVEKLSF